MVVRFTDQQVSAHAGTAVFWAWLHGTGWIQRLAAALPHPVPTSNIRLTARDKALAFVHGLLGEARKLTHVAYFRRDPLVPELLGIRRVPSQSTFSRFFAGFRGAGMNLRCFRTLWQWGMARLPSRAAGYALDLDSTRLLHVDGHQQGVHTGYTRTGFKPCLHPLLAVIAETRLVAQLWLRPGNTVCANNAVAFFQELWTNWPRHLRLRVVRADSGFCTAELLTLWEQLRLPCIVVAKLTSPVQSLLRHGLVWTPTELAGTDVTEVEYRALGWPHPRRLILIRHRQAERPQAGGKRLFDLPGYVFQALVTSLPATVPPLTVWREYNGRADCENVIKELQQGFALPTLCLASFWATEAALCLATLTYNLTVLFQRHLGWQTKVTIHSLRFWLFRSPGIIAHPAGLTTLKLAVPSRERDWWARVWDKILCPFPNCHAVENRPAFTT